MSSRFAQAAEDKLFEAKPEPDDAHGQIAKSLASAIVYALLDVASAVRALRDPEA